MALRPTVVVDEGGRHRRRGLPAEPGDALVVATSGTSGGPRAAVLTHDAVAAGALATSRALGVDAVIRTRVEKTRYMSELASWSTEVGLHVLHEASEGRVDWLIPPGLTRTDDIYADSTLLSGEDGDLLWKVAVHRATDWRRPANDVVVGITRKLAKKFPYRT